MKYSRTPRFRTRLIRSPRCFEVISLSLHLNQPRYFELINNRVEEQTPKRPTKSEVRQAIEILSRYSLFVQLREPRFEGKQASCLSTRVLEKTKSNRGGKDFSMQERLLKLSGIFITVFLFNQCLSSNCTVFYLKKCFIVMNCTT